MQATVDLSPWPAGDPIGQEIDGFRILSLLGAGGMGRVYKALDLRLKRLVAIKALTEPCSGDRELLARFEREVHALSALSHPNVAQIFSSGWFEGRPYYVMEYIDGSSLAAVLAEGRRLAGRRCLDHLIEAALGLEAALDKGIIHRDVKPGNLMVDARGRLKIVDFGLARSLLDDSSLTRSDRMLGTPLYIAPEQAQGGPVDHRADIYSLGASFYHLLTGEPPFGRDAPLALALRHLRSPLTPIKERNSLVPAAVAAIIERMMAKDPADRYSSYGELIADLERAHGGGGRRARDGRGEATESDLPAGAPAGPAVLRGSTARDGGGEARQSAAPAGPVPGADLPGSSPGARGRAPSASAGSFSSPRPARDRRLLLGLGAAGLVAAFLGLLAWPGPRTASEPQAEEASRSPSDPARGASASGRRRAGLGPGQPARGEKAPGLDPAALIRQAYAVGSQGNMRRLSTMVEAFLAERGDLPVDLAELATHFELHPMALVDGWRREIRYQPGTAPHYRLLCAGADGQIDTGDDLILEDGYFVDEAAGGPPGLE